MTKRDTYRAQLRTFVDNHSLQSGDAVRIWIDWELAAQLGLQRV